MHKGKKWNRWNTTLTIFTIIILIIILLVGFMSFLPKVRASENNNYYIKNRNRPVSLYVIDQQKMTKSENTMIASLQGIIASKSKTQIYTLDKSHPDYMTWLRDLKSNYSIKYEIVDNPWVLVDKFKKYAKGYVLYDGSNPKDVSINNACSIASLKCALVVDKSVENKVKEHGITKLLGDCRNTDKYWAYNNLWNSGLNHSTVIELNPSRSSALRDYAIMTKSLIFYEEDKNDSSLRKKVFGTMKKNGICLGWGPDEYGNISTASKYGINVVPADWSYNLSTLSAFPSYPILQKSSEGALKGISKKFNNIIKKDISSPAHYVTFIMSDGDNQQWYLGSNFSSPKWYGSNSRGNFNMGWTMSPSLYYLAPTVFRQYYRNASNGKHIDDFLVSPSGMGYIYPSKFEKSALKMQVKKLNEYMQSVGQNYAAIIDDKSFYNTELWDKYTKQRNIKGLFYLDYSRQDNYKGKIIWSNGKPMVSCRNLLWSGIEDENSLVDTINGYVQKGYTDTRKETAYTTVYVHAWSKNLEDVQKVINELAKNSKVRVVTPDDFMKLVKKNIVT
ncbi:protein phosphatase [Clostridium tyrobutyricum]|uniref:GxGYxYP domain-containing protein n=1 Tax=Clostridium tyrobutyricum TaxID=1519 RepID=UPI001C38FA13|nr:GxGYxYP domain-containing protein [Clostridium tyrobutyricum]MBV4450116.1 protein phosphatase [Clostridium tyrobutyricum]